MKPKQKAVFLDIDGTLLSGDSGPFDCDIEAINAAQQAGHYVFI
ncbi:MAG: HAD hydrolase family protein, partial [Spirochaetaceae bacterium]|nr:HAD hydrolase family protein [Spirochaetaceae bacterium]